MQFLSYPVGGTRVKIIVDAMGGDHAPGQVVLGALRSAREMGTEVVLVGRGEDILRVIDKEGLKEIPYGVEIVNASEVIGIDEEPARSIRQKKDSSLVVALTLLRDGRGGALVSAGSTGAILSGATLIVGRVRGIRRAALAPVIPNNQGGFVLIDCGANSECSPEYLLQFAYMGSFYAQDVLSAKTPRVGLLNNGAERTKGTQLQLETYGLLETAAQGGHLNFVGNVEPKEALKGACDVLVCDGFTGNILLKSIEGVASFVMAELKNIFLKDAATKLSALLVKRHLSGLRQKMNPDDVGGTAMLGISKPVIKAHGSSNQAAISSAIAQAVKSVETAMAERLHSNMGRMKIE